MDVSCNTHHFVEVVAVFHVVQLNVYKIQSDVVDIVIIIIFVVGVDDYDFVYFYVEK